MSMRWKPAVTPCPLTSVEADRQNHVQQRDPGTDDPQRGGYDSQQGSNDEEPRSRRCCFVRPDWWHGSTRGTSVESASADGRMPAGA